MKFSLLRYSYYFSPHNQNVSFLLELLLNFLFSCLNFLFINYFSRFRSSFCCIFLFFSKLFPTLFFRHPHGRFAAFLLSHCNEAIIFSFIISPIVCFPTLFVFKVRESYVEDSKVPLYHVYADKDTHLYRWVFRRGYAGEFTQMPSYLKAKYKCLLKAFSLKSCEENLVFA